MIALTAEARDVALAEVQEARSSADRKYAKLIAQLDEGNVEDLETLESVLESALQCGRIRALYGFGGEQAAITTLRKLPHGRHRGKTVASVREELQVLVGKPLGAVDLATVGPGSFTLLLSAGDVDLVVLLDRSGARLASVST